MDEVAFIWENKGKQQFSCRSYIGYPQNVRSFTEGLNHLPHSIYIVLMEI